MNVSQTWEVQPLEPDGVGWVPWAFQGKDLFCLATFAEVTKESLTG